MIVKIFGKNSKHLVNVAYLKVPHVPVARGASRYRGTLRKGHGGGVAYFTSTEYLGFLIEIISSSCILDKQIIIFSISLNIIAETKT